MKRKTRVVFGSLFILLLLAAMGPWDLAHAYFGTNGKVITLIGDWDYAYSLLIQPDGKIVAGGTNHGSGEFALVRYDSNGNLDNGFGTNGVVVTPFIGVADCYSLALQADGKIVAAGAASHAPPAPLGDSTENFILYRYLADGALDTGFGTGGEVITRVGVNDYARGVVIQPDHKIVAGGFADNQFALARYDENGSLDATFGGGGIVTTSIASNANAYALVRQPDGNLVLAGSCWNGSATCFTLARYLENGTLDAGFGSSGTTITPIGLGSSNAYSLVRQPDGKLVAGGYFSGGGQSGFALARYNSDGSLDPSFGLDGKVMTTEDIGTGWLSEVRGLVVQQDGKLVAAGTGGQETKNCFAVVRYNSDGQVDTGFGTGGIALVPVGNINDRAFALALQPDGKLVIAGHSNNNALPDPSIDGGYAVVRLNSDGTLDQYGAPTATPTSTPTPIDLQGQTVKAFPNPASDKVSFIMNLDQPTRVRMDIFSMAGERVATLEETLSGDNAVLTWLCGAVGPGVYLAKVSLDGQVVTLKIAITGKK
jgi:uncharacterized delta-60 repeat protein